MSCGCGKGKTAARRVANVLLRKGKTEHAIGVLLAVCCRSSECGRICPRLVKGPGAAQVYCVDPTTGAQVELYPAYTHRDFRCPEGRF